MTLARPTAKRRTGGKARRFDGELLDVTHGAAFLGCNEKTLRARVSRGLVPYRRFSKRIVFIRSELLAYLEGLPGVTLAEAKANLARRQGTEE